MILRVILLNDSTKLSVLMLEKYQFLIREGSHDASYIGRFIDLFTDNGMRGIDD